MATVLQLGTAASLVGLANAGGVCQESGPKKFRLQSGYALLTPNLDETNKPKPPETVSSKVE